MSTETEKPEAKPGPLHEVFSPYIFGIDLGTCNSCISFFRKGEASVINVEGLPTCPSVLSVLGKGEKLVGRQARGRLMIDPENSVASVKRQMGKEWSKEFAGIPGKKFSPEDVSAEILLKLVGAAIDSGVDLLGPPKYVVICTPANFNDAQKKATYEAARLANLEVIYLLAEPTAAALAYAFGKEADQTILVYDLGGGTFDVAILKLETVKDGPSTYKILATDGVPVLGGDDFDGKIMELAAGKFKTESSIDILDSKKDQGISTRALREAQQKLKESAEKAKCELSEAGSKAADIIIPSLIRDESGKVHNLEFNITLEQFNEAIRPLILQSKDAVERALKAAALAMADISRIVLVGGSTRVPLVTDMLKEMFGRAPYSDANPDTIVSRGAAIQGALLGVPNDKLDVTAEGAEGVIPKGTVTIQNIVTHFLGIEVQGGRFACLLEKGKDIPSDATLTVTKQFVTPRDNMSELRIAVHQTLTPAEVVGPGVECIGEFYLTGIPAKPRGQEKIDVTFTINQQNVLTVEATCTSLKDRPVKLEIKRS
jgi:molecular chaperone DnaK